MTPRADLNALEKYLNLPAPWKNNIIQDLEKEVLRKWSTFTWLRVVGMGSCEHGNKLNVVCTVHHIATC